MGGSFMFWGCGSSVGVSGGVACLEGMDKDVVEFLDEGFFGIFENTGAEVKWFESEVVCYVLEGGGPGWGVVGRVVEEEVGGTES